MIVYHLELVFVNIDLFHFVVYNYFHLNLNHFLFYLMYYLNIQDVLINDQHLLFDNQTIDLCHLMITIQVLMMLNIDNKQVMMVNYIYYINE